MSTQDAREWLGKKCQGEDDLRAALEAICEGYARELDKYNGWANRETWCVNLWLSNEPHLWGGAEDAARRVDVRHAAPGAVRNFVELEMLGDIEPGSLAWDLLSSALDAVDWYRLVEVLLDPYEEA